MTARRTQTLDNRSSPPYRLLIMVGVGVLLFGGLLGYAVQQAVAAPAPAFSLPALGGGNVSLSQYAGKDHVLLYFNMGTG